MPSYNSAGYRPPAPIASVTVRSPASGETVPVVAMLLDTGADVSLLPREAIRALLDSTQVPRKYELEAFDGTTSWAAVAQLEVEFLGKTFKGQFLVMEGSTGIIGRNILNALTITFDGPNLDWHE